MDTIRSVTVQSPGTIANLVCGFDVARICAGTWNVGGRVPSSDLDIDGWLDTLEPADIYVLGYVFFSSESFVTTLVNEFCIQCL